MYKKRTKQFLCLLLSICLAATCLVFPAAADCEHDFVNNICKYCQRSYCDINGHDYINNDDQESCTVCGVKRCANGDHVYDSGGNCLYCTNYNEYYDILPRYTVTFMDGTTTLSTSTVKIGNCVEKPADPEKTNFTFTGWFEEGETTAFDFDTPISEDTTLYAHFAAAPVYSYIGADGSEAETTNYTLVTSSETNVEWSGTMIASGNVTINGNVKLTGDTNLILCDDAKLTVDYFIDSYVDSDYKYSMNIFGQTEHSGKLTSRGIFGKDISIYGGDITAVSVGIYAVNACNIVRGKVHAHGYGNDGYGIESGNSITISGGEVTVGGEKQAICSEKGTVTLGWTEPGDKIVLDASWVGANRIIFDNAFIIDENGTLATEDNIIWGNETLTPAYAVTFMDGETTLSAVGVAATGEATVTKPADPTKTGGTFVGWFEEGAETAFDFENTYITKDTTLYARFTMPEISYIGADGNEATTTDYTIITSTTTKWSGTMVVPEDTSVTINGQVDLTATTNLILCDGCELTISNVSAESDGGYGIGADLGIFIYSDLDQYPNLSVYAQQGETGKLNVSADLTISSINTVSFYGGNINLSSGTFMAESECNGFCIYALSDVIIAGGNITFNGAGAGEYSAESAQPAIFADNNITITGGNVVVNDPDGIWANGTITLGWTNPTDSIKTNSYIGTVNFTKPFVIEDGTLATENNIAKQTLTPAYAVTFMDGETTLSAVGVAATGEATVTKPADPTKEGFVFTGWYLENAETAFDFTTAITADTTLYAHFTQPAGNFSALQTLIKDTENNGTLVLYSDYTALSNESCITIPEGKTMTLDLNGHTIDRNLSEATGDGYVIKVYGNLTLKDSSDNSETEEYDGTGMITGGNNSYQYGGGMYVEEDGTFTMTGGTISGNTANYGGGVYVEHFGTFTMTGGTITGNTDSGVYVDGTFTMTGGTISGNTAGTGGGVFVYNGTFTMTGGTISENTAEIDGGGVYVFGTFTMTDGTITGNEEETNGGGVYVHKNGTFYLKNGVTVSDDVVAPGTIKHFGTVTITETTGGTITASEGTLTVLDDTFYIEGATVTLTVTPASFSPVVKDSAGNNVEVTGENGTFTFKMPDKDVTVEPKKFTVAVTPVDTSGNAVAVQGSWLDSYLSGTSVTLTAPAAEGYNFVGWYAGETKLCGTNAYTFTITENVDLIAKYEALGKVSLTIDGGSSFTINGDAKSTSITADYTLGTTITAATNTAKFAYWKNSYGMVLSRSASYTFTVTGADTITAVFDTVVENKATLVFESAYGQVMAREQLATGGSMEIPSLPYRNGYTAKGWDMNGDGEYNADDTLAAAITRGLAATNNMVVISPVYELKTATYTIEVVNGTGGGTYNQNDKVTVTANAPGENEKFSHWTDGTSILSYNASYPFFADRNLTLTAVFVAEETVVEAKGTTEIIESTTDGTKLIYVSMSTVPEGCKIEKAGFIVLKNPGAEMTSEAKFIDTNADYIMANPWDGSAYRYTLSINNTSGATWYVRAYLRYMDANGNTHTVYGSIMHN